jgi:Uma2 family endonuclease
MRVTLEKYLARPQTLYKIEVLDGELLVKPRTSVWHNEVVRRIAATLRPLEPQWTIVFEGSLQLRKPDPRSVTVLGPDIMVLPTSAYEDALRDDRKIYLDIPPVLVIEVLSKGNRAEEMERKVHTYLRNDILQVWSVDPHQQQITHWGRDVCTMFRTSIMTAPPLPIIALNFQGLFRR